MEYDGGGGDDVSGVCPFLDVGVVSLLFPSPSDRGTTVWVDEVVGILPPNTQQGVCFLFGLPTERKFCSTHSPTAAHLVVLFLVKRVGCLPKSAKFFGGTCPLALGEKAADSLDRYRGPSQIITLTTYASFFG